MKNYILLLIVIFLIGNVHGQSKKAIEDHSSEILVVAHRGAHNRFPENSISSIKEAIELGVDMVEIDVRHTKDNMMILMHDETLDRTTNGKGLVSEHTWEEIKGLQLKNNDGTVSAYNIPLLKDILMKFKDRILFDLDIKTPYFVSVIELVELTKSSSACFFLLDDEDKAMFLRRRNNDLKILFAPKDETSLLKVMEQIKPEIIHLNDKINTKLVNSIVKKAGSRTFINSLWNIDRIILENSENFHKLYQHGANMIQTDYPEILLRHLRINKLHK
ncbi:MULTISPECIES: glycerophosphodiester phosphodiesterase family protein [Sphingobacterium]|uniref:glycerophosphodiester phosphodiesterase family protein n=1 Tax=Sphingobacterium TaxID=28453 RepID=UPI000E8C33EF|nr:MULTISPECIES: glycerophosphodiester phosphodiesterase family protein [Sphingobacterium]HBI86566.1 hypothetical protein [Sphingobacterium sp.]